MAVDVLVIGGGIAGLTAAWTLQSRGISYMVLEASARWGGKMLTDTLDVDGQTVVIDGGPESFITRKREVWDLAHALGIQEQIIRPMGETQGMYVLFHGKPHRVPVSPPAFVTSSLLTWGGKLRMLAEPFIPPRRDFDDESLADFVRRRLGSEALERFIGPILGGIYNTNPEQQSILVSSPVMREMEHEFGGLFKGAIGRARQRRAAQQQLGTPVPPAFITFKGGAADLVNALIQRLTGSMRLNAQVSSISRSKGVYQVFLNTGETITAQALILAAPANTASQLLRPLLPEVAAQLSTIPHTNLGTISLVYRESDLPASLKIRGLMIPRREQRAIDAITRTSERVPHRAPQGLALFRVFFGGSRPDLATMPDDRLLAVVRDELTTLLGIQAEPRAYRAYRWIDGYPQANVGHLDHVSQIEAALPPEIALAGASYRGVGVPDCILQGQEAGERLALTLKHADVMT